MYIFLSFLPVWFLIYLQLSKEWKYPIFSLLLITLYYQYQYQKKKDEFKNDVTLLLGMAIHATFLGWVLLFV
tara:strand:+ start:425 stop:640 length:216 start_codon:yes stop_codon:yes gene_type:complete